MRRATDLIRFVLLTCAASLVLGIGAGGARAQSTMLFSIRSAYLHLVEGVYVLDARLQLPIDARLRELLNDGVGFKLELQIEVSRARSYWPDEGIASLAQQYELQYHAVSDRYVVRNINSGEQTTYPEFEPAVEHLTRITGLPVLDQSLLDKNKDGKERSYEVRMRAITDVGGMPAALRWVMFWVDDWHRTSEWYVWSLQLP